MSATETPTGADEAGHHEYDGIIEHDNHLPRWWLVTLYGAMVFAAGYWIWFQVLGVGVLPRQEFDEALHARAVAEEARDAAAVVNDEVLLAMSRDPEVLEKGKATFMSTCLACHGDRGQGLVGPNLTDEAWIHGSDPMKILEVIGDGVIAKGMPAWKPALGSGRVKEVTAWVLTLKGTNVAGKASEGTLR